MSIPKVIHYCWFGKGEKPELALKCIESWKKYCPDYEIKEWNEENFDIDSNEYVKQAYESKKYAFVSDYVRLYALYNYGGIYMDTDVEILKPLDEFLIKKAFSGFENNNMLTTGLMAAEKEHIWIKDLLDSYNGSKFIDENGEMNLTTNVVRVTNYTKENYGLKLESSFQELQNGIITIYPFDYFSPKDWDTGEIKTTENTYTIHHFSASWHNEEEKSKIEEYRKRLNKYVKKYGEELGKEKLNKHDIRIYYLKHPCKAVKRIFEKMKGDNSEV